MLVFCRADQQLFIVYGRRRKKTRLFTDGGGSPVKGDVIELGESCDLGVVIMTSVDHYAAREYTNHVRIVYVDRETDSAGYEIVDVVRENDPLIIQGYGLTSFVLSRGARVFHHSRKGFGEANIDALPEQCYYSKKLRKVGIRTKGPEPSTEKDHMFSRQVLKKATDQGSLSTEDNR